MQPGQLIASYIAGNESNMSCLRYFNYRLGSTSKHKQTYYEAT